MYRDIFPLKIESIKHLSSPSINTTPGSKWILSDVLIVSLVKLSLVQLVKWIKRPTKLLKISLTLRENWVLWVECVLCTCVEKSVLQTCVCFPALQQTWRRLPNAYVFCLFLISLSFITLVCLSETVPFTTSSLKKSITASWRHQRRAENVVLQTGERIILQ